MLAAKVVNIMKKEDRRAVQREVDIMRRLQHPRLIQLYDAIDAGKQIYVVLELYVFFSWARRQRRERKIKERERDALCGITLKFLSFKDRWRRAV